MVQLKFDLPDGVFSSLRKDPDSLAKDLRLAAAVKWYELRAVSQERAAEIAGLSRTEFIFALARFGVSPFQAGTGEITEEAGRA